MVRKGILFGHKVSKRGIEVDVIFKLSILTSVKQVKSFLNQFGFHRRFGGDFLQSG